MAEEEQLVIWASRDSYVISELSVREDCSMKMEGQLEKYRMVAI